MIVHSKKPFNTNAVYFYFLPVGVSMLPTRISATIKSQAEEVVGGAQCLKVAGRASIDCTLERPVLYLVA